MSIALFKQIYDNYTYLQTEIKSKHIACPKFLKLFRAFENDPYFRFLFLSCIEEDDQVNTKWFFRAIFDGLKR